MLTAWSSTPSHVSKFDGSCNSSAECQPRTTSDVKREYRISPCYPSPPMSRSSTPRRQVPSVGSSSSVPSVPAAAPAAIAATSSASPGSSITASISGNLTSAVGTVTVSRIEPFPDYQNSDQPPDVQHLSSYISTAANPAPLTTTVYSTSTSISTGPPPGNLPSVIASVGVRTSRKGKVHVASACINCKRAHLSCDVQRPCRRCVDNGKESTCYDVQHKKRGRPRLRDDNESSAASSSQQTVNLRQNEARQIAGARSRRAESFRSHQSMDSASSSIGQMTPVRGGMPSMQELTSIAQSNSSEIPVAILDLDLNILRTNRAFRHVLSMDTGGFGRHISEIVTPGESESLMGIRNNLRRERERRDPSYLPPILAPGHDPLQDVHDEDLDRWTQDFPTSTYTWRASRDGTSTATFRANVRLGKAAVYFAVVTLVPVMVRQQFTYGSMPQSMMFATAFVPTSYPPSQQQSLQPLPSLQHQQDQSQMLATQATTTSVEPQTARSSNPSVQQQSPMEVPPQGLYQGLTYASSQQAQPSAEIYTPGPRHVPALLAQHQPQAHLSPQRRLSDMPSSGLAAEQDRTQQARSSNLDVVSMVGEDYRSGSEEPDTKRRKRIGIDEVLE